MPEAAPVVAPACACRECQGPMEAIFQPALLPGREGAYLVTCWNRACQLYGYTLSAARYPHMDLSAYLESASA